MQGNEDFWEERGKKYRDDPAAVNFDPLEDELERWILDKVLTEPGTLCDFGCGNGSTTVRLAKKFPASALYGGDSAPSMIGAANLLKAQQEAANVHFVVEDAKGAMPVEWQDKFDTVLSKRLLINLRGRQKIAALKNIHSILKKGGTYLMIECFIEPLARTNAARAALDLPEIAVHAFNEYLTEDFMEEVKKYFEIIEHVDFESEYYYISRVYNAHLSGGKPSYTAAINLAAVELTKKGLAHLKGYAPESLFILEKK